MCSVASVMSNSLQRCGLQPAKLLFMDFLRQEYWSELPFPPPGDLPTGIKPASPVASALHTDSLPLSLQGSPITAYRVMYITYIQIDGLGWWNPPAMQERQV